MRGISRRDFLTAVGAAGGADAMFGTMGALGLAPTAMGAADYRPPQPSDFRLSGRAAALVRVIGPGRVRTGCAVTGITNGDNGVSVTYTRGGREQRIDADYCIAAMPPHASRTTWAPMCGTR